MAIERFVNNFQTTLSSGIDGSTTTIPVAAGTSVASQFRIRIDDEILIVTAGGTGTSWTATRGAESTSNVSHSSGATVTVVLTAGAIQQMIADQNRSGTFASLPATSDALAGHIYLPTDEEVYSLVRFNGSSWNNFRLKYTRNDVKASRAYNTTYQNTSNGLLFLTICGFSGSTGNHTLKSDSSNPPTTTIYDVSTNGGFVAALTAVIKKNDYYRLDHNTGSITINQWFEDTLYLTQD